MRHRLAPLVCFAVLGATVLASASFFRLPSRSEHDTVQSGRRIFEKRCALCNTTGERAAEGPGLGGVLGRRAASMPFGYSRALREAGLTWDRVTLDHFLAAPGQLVVGTTMPVAVPDDVERHAVVEYLATLAASDASAPMGEAPVDIPSAAPGLRTGHAASATTGATDREYDAITTEDLPAPSPAVLWRRSIRDGGERPLLEH